MVRGLRFTFFKVNFILFCLALFFNLSIEVDSSVWKGMGDPPDYLHHSNISLFDSDFWAPKKTESFSPRPFATALFYKIVNGDPGGIINLQIIVHTISTFLLCSSLLHFFKNNISKVILLFFVYLFMSWWNIMGWCHTLLSESLSMSLLFIWFSSFLYLIRNKRLWVLFIHLFITIIFSFTRDTWPYVFIGFYGIWFVIEYLRKVNYRYILSMLIVSVVLFFVQQKTAEIGHRYKLPVINSIVFDILPNDEYLQWFVDKGMPDSELLKSNLSNINPDDGTRVKLYEAYNDTIYDNFYNWVLEDGKSVYSTFLVVNPMHSLLLQNETKDASKMFSYNLFGYTGEVQQYSSIAHEVFPVFNIWMLIVLLIITMLLYYKIREIKYIIPSVLSVVFMLNALLLYNADALEVERHVFITNIMMQLIGIISSIMIIDNIKTLKEFNIARKTKS